MDYDIQRSSFYFYCGGCGSGVEKDISVPRLAIPGSHSAVTVGSVRAPKPERLARELMIDRMFLTWEFNRRGQNSRAEAGMMYDDK